MRLIDADRLTEDFEGFEQYAGAMVKAIINAAPSVQFIIKVDESATEYEDIKRGLYLTPQNVTLLPIEEPRTARWMPMDYDVQVWQCSNCAFENGHRAKYCENCGAFMNGGRKND